MRGSSFKQIKLSRSLENTENCTLKGFARLSQIKLQQLCTGKESIVLKSLPAAVILYFTASEKDKLPTESYSYIACVQTSPLPQEKSGEETYVNRRR